MIVVSITKIIFKVQVRKFCSVLKPAETIAAAHFYGSWPQVQCIFTYPYKQDYKLISPVMLWGMGKPLKAWAYN